MSKKLYALLLSGMFISQSLIGQISYQDVQFWVGSGTDTTLLVVDFQDGTPDSSYVWGYLHNGNQTGEDLLNAVAAADVNFNMDIDTASFGNFLNSIWYINHEGIGGTPDYWGTWDGTDLNSLVANQGIASSLVSGGIFGCSYMDFNPSIPPGQPWAAFDSSAFGFKDVSWYGNGPDSTLLIIDFLNGTDTASFAWGFRFTDSIQDITLLDSIAAAINQLTVSISGGVNSISYRGLSGQASATNDWYGWIATNYGNWQAQYTNRTYVKNGEMLAFTFIQNANLERPHVPETNTGNIGLMETELKQDIQVFPIPAREKLNVIGQYDRVCLYNVNGQKVLQTEEPTFSVDHLKAGFYMLRAEGANQAMKSITVIIQ